MPVHLAQPGHSPPNFGFSSCAEIKYSRAVDRTSSFTERFIRTVGTFVGRLIYRVSAHGMGTLPEGGFLLLPNHLTWIDAIVLQLACPRPIRFIVWEDIPPACLPACLPASC